MGRNKSNKQKIQWFDFIININLMMQNSVDPKKMFSKEV